MSPPIKVLFRLKDDTKHVPSLIQAKYGKAFLRKHLWKYEYLITKILSISCQRTHRWDKYYRVRSHDLERLFGQIRIHSISQRALSVIRQDLNEWDIIRFTSKKIHHKKIHHTSISERIYYKILDEVRLKGWQSVKEALHIPFYHRLHSVSPPLF
jgi:hypothetical protein